MPATIITTLMVILVVTTASANQSLGRAKRQGEDQPPPNATTCPQLILPGPPGPPGPPGGLSYSEAKELKQDIKEELQESLAEWIRSQAKAETSQTAIHWHHLACTGCSHQTLSRCFVTWRPITVTLLGG